MPTSWRNGDRINAQRLGEPLRQLLIGMAAAGVTFGFGRLFGVAVGG